MSSQFPPNAQQPGYPPQGNCPPQGDDTASYSCQDLAKEAVELSEKADVSLLVWLFFGGGGGGWWPPWGYSSAERRSPRAWKT